MPLKISRPVSLTLACPCLPGFCAFVSDTVVGHEDEADVVVLQKRRMGKTKTYG